MSAPREERIFFIQPPAFHDLCSIVVNVPVKSPPNETKSQQAQQPQVIKCRELIFTEPEILATPSLQHDNNMTVIMQQSLFRTGRLQARLQKMGCKSEKPRRVLPAEYESCLSYTLLARLAPNWNKVGDYLIQGRDFVTSQHKLNGVHFEVHVTDQEMFFSIIPSIVKSQPSELSDLGICTPVIREFESTKDEGRIEEYSIENKWCHILPSMKKGQVIHVYHQLPPDSPFKSYKDMKKHWKNSYGYRLPEDDTDIVYYQVYFKMIGDFLFTYPNICIRSRPVMSFPRSDPGPILQTFLADLHTKLPSVCGQKLQVLKNPHYFTPGIAPLTQAQGSLNLTLSAPSNKYGYRPNQPQIIGSQSEARPPSFTQYLQSLSRSSQNGPRPENVEEREKSVKDSKCPPDGGHTGTNASLGEKIVPQFKARPTFKPNPLSTKTQASKLVPVFRGNLQKTSSSHSTHTASVRDSMNLAQWMLRGEPGRAQHDKHRLTGKIQNNNKIYNPDQLKPHGPPQISTSKDIDHNRRELIFNMDGMSGLIPNMDGAGGSEGLVRMTTTPTSTATSMKGLKTSTGLPPAHQYSQEGSTAPTLPPPPPRYHDIQNTMTSKRGLPGVPAGSRSEMEAYMLGLRAVEAMRSWPAFRHTPGLGSSELSMSQGIVPPSQNSTSFKRKWGDPEGGESKRVRSKSGVQENMNVKELAYSGQLQKANTATLLAWLRARGIACRTKDKKAELVAKITEALSIGTV